MPSNKSNNLTPKPNGKEMSAAIERRLNKKRAGSSMLKPSKGSYKGFKGK